MLIRYLHSFVLILPLLIGCTSIKKKDAPSQPGQPSQLTANDTTPPIPDTKSQPLPLPPLKTHLHDTTYVEGAFILFLRPNDARYAELDSISEEIGEGDSDFGVGISNTLDSLKSNPAYKNIKGLVSEKRYIVIKDCLAGPKVIDRDTINYGFILSTPGKAIDTEFNSVHSGDYREEIDHYFFGKGI